MTLDEYKAELRSHDWTFEYSDDPRYYHRGEQNKARLLALAKDNPEFQAAYKEEAERVFAPRS